MATTLDTLTSSATTGVRLQYVVCIEGYQYLLTDGPTARAITAYAATDWTAALGGLSIRWSQSQRIAPWEPFASNGSSVTLLVMDETGSDTFGKDVFNREGGVSTRVSFDEAPDAAVAGATIEVQSTGSFAAAPGYAYLGPEAFKYGAKGAASFTSVTRGWWSPSTTGAAGRFSRYHRALTTVEGPDPLAVPATQVRDRPTTWKGRWVYVYVHRVVGTVLDTKAEALLVFAGKIATVADMESGHTQVVVEDMRKVVTDHVVMREQWRAKLRPVVFVGPSTQFDLNDSRAGGGVALGRFANRLHGVVGAATVNEIEPGFYTLGELASKIQDWLSSETLAGRTMFRYGFSVDATLDGEPRSTLTMSDPSTGLGVIRQCRLNANHRVMRGKFGWGADGIGGNTSANYYETFYSDVAPNVTPANHGGQYSIGYEAESGAFVSQASTLPPTFSDATFAAVGAIRIGNNIFPCTAPSAGVIRVRPPVNAMVGLDNDPNWADTPIAQGGDVAISQVLITQASFKSLVLYYLASTGASNFNWTGYDIFPDHVGAAIPYDLISSLEAELAACPESDDIMTVIVDKPTRLADLFHTSFVLRTIQFVWRQGKLHVKGLSTPTTAAALTLSNATKFGPLGVEDKLRAVSEETDELMRNTITIKHSGSPLGGEYRDTTTIVDASSAAAHGSRALTLTARNAVRGTGEMGEDIGDLVRHLASAMSFLGRPLLRIKVPIGITEFETHTAGETVLITDPFVRDPQTGARSLSARPGFILADWHDWSACVGEVEVIIFPGLTVAQWSPCARVDETANTGGFTAGYDAGVRLRCVANYHSRAGTAVDASFFAFGDQVRVVEVDPDTAASPLTWLRQVTKVDTSDIWIDAALAGYDATKLYRIVADDYATSTVAQRTRTYQADDADGLVQSLRAPYSLAHFGHGQASPFTLSFATDLPAKPPDLAFGNGKPLDTGHAYDLATSLNNLVSYKAAVQAPEVTDVATWTSGTWWTVYSAQVYIGIGRPTNLRSRKLWVSPTISKAGGASSQIRVTLSNSPPTSADVASPSRADMVRNQPYSETTFTTTSAVRENQAAVALNTEHLQLAPSLLGGVAWLTVEVKQYGYFYGLGLSCVGPVVTP